MSASPFVSDAPVYITLRTPIPEVRAPHGLTASNLHSLDFLNNPIVKAAKVSRTDRGILLSWPNQPSLEVPFENITAIYWGNTDKSMLQGNVPSPNSGISEPTVTHKEAGPVDARPKVRR